MGKKTQRARQRLQQGAFIVPSPQEIEAAMTPAGAWTALTLAQWGVPWPPPKGWRRRLEQQWENERPAAD